MLWSSQRPLTRLSCLSDMHQLLLTSDPSCFVQRSHSSALIPLDTAAHSPKIDAYIIIRAENALHRGPKNPNLRNSQAEVVQIGDMCKKLGRWRGLAFSEGVRRGSLAAAVEGSEFALLSLRLGSVLTPLSGTETVTSQYCRIV